MKVVYKSRKFRVIEKDLKGARPYKSAFIDHQPVAVIIAVKGNKVVLERQYRENMKKWFYELPAGLLDKRESMEKLAKDELIEETGYVAKKLRLLFKAYAAVGTSNERYYFYLAEQLTKGKRNLEPWETIEVHEVTIGKAMDMIKRNLITDAKAVMGISYYYNFILMRKK